MLLMTVTFELSTSPLLPGPQLLAALTRGTVLDGPQFLLCCLWVPLQW